MTPDNRHKHLIVRAEVNKPPQDEDREFVEAWLGDLINSIGMKALTHPQAIYCFTSGNRGMTAHCIIETSHICLHSWDECSPAIIQFDLYTCSDLDPQAVIRNLHTTFETTKVEFKYLDREHDLTMVDQNVLLHASLDNAINMMEKAEAHFWSKSQ